MVVLRRGRVVGELVQEFLPRFMHIFLQWLCTGSARLSSRHRGADALVHAEGREPRLGRGAGAGELPEGQDRIICDRGIVGKRAQHLTRSISQQYTATYCITLQNKLCKTELGVVDVDPETLIFRVFHSVFYFKERNTEVGVVDVHPQTLIFRVFQTIPISVFYLKERNIELGVVDLHPETLIFRVFQTTPISVFVFKERNTELGIGSSSLARVYVYLESRFGG